MEYILYHASVESFKIFDENKIRECETDAPFNGFWFSSDKRTSSAWINPKYLKTCKITLNNPCSWTIIYELIKDNKYSCTELRKKLLSLGYDGIIFEDKPVIEEAELKETGETIFKTVRGTEYKLKLDEYGYVDLYDKYDECITGYCNVEDYLSMQEQVVVVFSNESIEILEEIQNHYWN